MNVMFKILLQRNMNMTTKQKTTMLDSSDLQVLIQVIISLTSMYRRLTFPFSMKKYPLFPYLFLRSFSVQVRFYESADPAHDFEVLVYVKFLSCSNWFALQPIIIIVLFSQIVLSNDLNPKTFNLYFKHPSALSIAKVHLLLNR